MREHLKTSFDSMRRAPFQALAAISVLTLTFFVTTMLAVLVYSSHQVLRYLETRPQVIAFLKDNATPQEVEALRNNLLEDTRVKTVVHVTKEEALKIYKDATSDNPLLVELVSPSTLPASIEFSVVDLKFAQELVDQLKSNSVVDEVSFTANIGNESSMSDVISRLRTVATYIRIGGVITVAILTATSFLVLMVVISMRIATRKSEIESLSLIGATPGFIRFPVILEAIHYAIIGVSVGFLVSTVILLYSTPTILSYFQDIPILPRDSITFFEMLGALYAIELLVGLFIAWTGSIIAVSRSLRMIK
jgi:cell division transport system permease protein